MRRCVFRACLILVCSGLLLITACKKASESNEPTQLVYGLTLSPSGIDPHINASSELGIPLTNVYDTLVYQDPNTGEFVPGLAKSWDISTDGLTYTYSLRDDVSFHDGTPFNAQAVKTNLDRISDPATASQKAVFMLGPYERTEVVDEYTVSIYLKRPYAPLLDSLSQVYLGMASPTALEKWGDDYQFHQVGSGPFKFVDYEPNVHLKLERNPNYGWGPSLYRSKTAHLDEIIFRFFSDPATRAVALETGEVHLMGEMPPLDAQRLAKDAKYTLEAIAIPGQPLQFFFNTALAPTDDLQVRQALLLATDRESIVNTMFGETSPVAYGPLSAVSKGYDATVKSLSNATFDPTQAVVLLENAGWSDSGRDGLRDKDGSRLHLKMALGGWGFGPDVAQLLQAQWAAIGVELSAEVVPYGELAEIGRAGSYHLIGFNLFGRDPNVLWSFYHSQGGFNWSQVADPALDTLLDEAAAATDPSTRDELYGRVQKTVMEQALVLPIRDYVNLITSKAEVQDLRFDAQGWFPWLIDVSLEN